MSSVGCTGGLCISSQSQPGPSYARRVIPRTSLSLVVAALLLSACGGGAAGTAGPSATPTSSLSVPANLDEVIASVNAHAPTRVPETADSRMLGADVSWPQCPAGMGIPERRTEGRPMPTDEAKFVLFGLTNGPSFTQNPCLAGQVAWARERGLMASAYAVVSYPTPAMLEQVRYSGGPYDGSTPTGALQNAGYAAGTYSIGTLRAAHLTSPGVWLDVEPVPDFDWSQDPAANRAVVEGAAKAWRDAGFVVGYYSVPSLWKRIVGDLATDGAPEWRAAGQTSMREALSRCSASWSFGGGPAVLAQWVEEGRDRNVACPGYGGTLGTWFTRLVPA